MAEISSKKTIETYKKHVMEVSRKNNLPIENLDEKLDGQIVKMLIEQNHLMEHIINAVREFSPVAWSQSKSALASSDSFTQRDIYANNLAVKSQDAIKAVKDIHEFDEHAERDTLFSEYKYLAKQHLAKSEAAIDITMDAFILSEMTKKDYSLGDIKNAVLKMSPIAKEPGRDPHEYFNFVMFVEKGMRKISLRKEREQEQNILLESSETTKESLAMDLKQTSEDYQKMIQYFTQNNIDVYHDGKAVKTLIYQGHMPENIKQAVVKFSPVIRQQTDGKQILAFNSLEYAANLINKAQNVITAVEGIKEFSVPQDVKLDAFSEYKKLAKWHLARNEASLNSNMDVAIAFKMLQSEHSLLNIEKAVLEMSPVAKEAGRSAENYAKYVVETAAQNRETYLEKQRINNENYPYTVQEYSNKKISLEKARNFISSHAYQEGRIVRELIEQGHSKNNLIKAIIEKNMVEEDKKPVNFAKYIVNGVISEISAEKAIRDFDAAVIDANKTLTLNQEYLNRARKIFERNKDERFSSSIDTFVAKTLLKDGFNAEKIKETIAQLSPINKQPGMAFDYPAQVIEKAYEKIALEQENIRKLNANYPVAAKEYIRQVERWKVANPEREYSDYSDGKISIQLLRNGHEPENIRKILSELSVVAHNLKQEKGTDTERYGKAIVYYAMQSMERYDNAKSVVPNWTNGLPPVKEAYQSFLSGSMEPGKPYLNADTDINISRILFEHGYEPDEIKNTVIKASPVAIEPGRKAESYANYVQEKAFGPSLEREDIEEFLDSLARKQMEKLFLSNFFSTNERSKITNLVRSITVKDLSASLDEKIKENNGKIVAEKKTGNNIKNLVIENQEMRNLKTMLNGVVDRSQNVTIKGAVTAENIMKQKTAIGKQISNIRNREKENTHSLGKER